MSTSTQPPVPASRFFHELGDYLSVDELAQYLQLSKETTYHWRLEGTGPKATKVGAADVAPTTTMLGVTRLAIPGQMIELEGTAVA